MVQDYNKQQVHPTFFIAGHITQWSHSIFGAFPSKKNRVIVFANAKVDEAGISIQLYFKMQCLCPLIVRLDAIPGCRSSTCGACSPWGHWDSGWCAWWPAARRAWHHGRWVPPSSAEGSWGRMQRSRCRCGCAHAWPYLVSSKWQRRQLSTSWSLHVFPSSVLRKSLTDFDWKRTGRRRTKKPRSSSAAPLQERLLGKSDVPHEQLKKFRGAKGRRPQPRHRLLYQLLKWACFS